MCLTQLQNISLPKPKCQDLTLILRTNGYTEAVKLTATDVAKIAALARLRLTDEETERYREQLSAILEHVAQLDEVDTSNVPATAQVTGLKNVLAHDEVQSQDSAKLRNGVPLSDGDLIKVRAVFGE